MLVSSNVLSNKVERKTWVILKPYQAVPACVITPAIDHHTKEVFDYVGVDELLPVEECICKSGRHWAA